MCCEHGLCEVSLPTGGHAFVLGSLELALLPESQSLTKNGPVFLLLPIRQISDRAVACHWLRGLIRSLQMSCGPPAGPLQAWGWRPDEHSCKLKTEFTYKTHGESHSRIPAAADLRYIPATRVQTDCRRGGTRQVERGRREQGRGGQPRTPGGTPTEPWGASSPACPDAHPASALQTGILSCECVPASAVSMATRLPQNTRCSLAKVPFTFVGSPISAPNSGGKAIAAPTGLAAELLPLGETRVARAEVLAEAGGRETGTLPKCPSPRGLTQGSSVLFWAGAPCTISPSLVHHHCFRVDCGVCVSRCHHVRQLSCEVATVNFSTLERGGAQGHVTDLWL